VAQLFYGKQPFTGSSSTSAAAGYPAANATFESVSRHWRSTSVNAEEWVGTFAAALAVNTFCLHDVNFAAATIQKSVDGVVFVNVGVMTTYADRHGRRRGRILINDANVKAIKVQIAAGAPTDSTNTGYWAGVTPVWRIGAAYAFASTVTPSAFPKYAYRRSTRRPRVVGGSRTAASPGRRRARTWTR
jgi:hypothetical protein